MQWKSTGAAVAATLMTAVSALATTPADKCESGKNRIAGAYYACREKAEAASVIKGLPADYSKCSTKFDEKWDAAESAGIDLCPDDVLTAPMSAYIAGQAAEAALIIAGDHGIPVCGDNEVDAVGEQCDGTDLDGFTCELLGHNPGTLACTGSCEFDTTACNDCPGFRFGDDCWLLSVAGSNCNTVCGAAGMVYDGATEMVTGSSGTDANCQTVLDGLSALGSGLPTAMACSGFGCNVSTSGFRQRCTTTTTSTATSLSQRRACACH